MSKRIFYPLLLLVIPAVGMLVSDDIHWTILDFVVMGALLLGVGLAIHGIRRHTAKPKKRVLYIAAVILLFLVIWAELAVGIFGSVLAGS